MSRATLFTLDFPFNCIDILDAQGRVSAFKDIPDTRVTRVTSDDDIEEYSRSIYKRDIKRDSNLLAAACEWVTSSCNNIKSGDIITCVSKHLTLEACYYIWGMDKRAKLIQSQLPNDFIWTSDKQEADEKGYLLAHPNYWPEMFDRTWPSENVRQMIVDNLCYAGEAEYRSHIDIAGNRIPIVLVHNIDYQELAREIMCMDNPMFTNACGTITIEF